MGYSNIKLEDGSKMAGAIFKGITTDGMKLTQLIPGGYLNHPVWTAEEDGEGCKGYIYIEMLNEKGKVATDKDGNAMRFNWYHDYDSYDFFVWSNPRWRRQLKNGTWVDITTANDITILKGQALWISVQKDWINGLTIQNSGEALLSAAEVPLEDGSTPVVVPLSTDTKLTEVVPVGYLNHPVWTAEEDGEGCKGYIYIEILNEKGKVATDNEGNLMRFNWYHDYDSYDFFVWSNPRWRRQLKNGTWVDITTENDYTIKASDGLWVTVQKDWINGLAISNQAVKVSN